METKTIENKISLPSRPKLTKFVGRYSEKIVTNYYKINLFSSNQTIYQFELLFEPDIPRDSRDLIQQAVGKIEKEMVAKLGPFVHKGTMVWATQNGPEDLGFVSEFKDQKTGIEHKFTVLFKRTAKFRLEDLNQNPKEAQKVIQLLNSLLKKKMSKIKGYKEMGKSCKYYDLQASKQNIVEDSKLKVMKGFTTSIHLLNGSPYLLVDVSTRVLRNESLAQTIKKQKNAELMVGRTVLANYGNNRTYRIDGIATNMTPLSTFSKNGKPMTYKEYYRSFYNIQITDDKQFLVKTVVKRKVMKNKELVEEEEDIYLIPELLSLTGMEDNEVSDFKMMQRVSKFTKMEPQERRDKASKLVNNLRAATDKTDLFEIEQAEKTMNGYLLPQPIFEFGNGKTEVPKAGQLNSRAKVFNAVNLNRWALVYTAQRGSDDDEADDLVRSMKDAGKSYGINVEEPDFYRANFNDWKDLEKVLSSLNKKEQLLIVVVLISGKAESHCYSRIKKELLLNQGLVNQVIRKETLKKNIMSVCSKIVLQMNAKIGAPLWRIQKKHPELEKKKIIIGGMAIYHKLITESKSCAAFYGTSNFDLNKFYCNAKLMNPNQQRFDTLSELVVKWVQTYCQSNKTVPEIIVLFREGVGEGSIQNILDTEVAVLKRAVTIISEKMKIPNYKPGIAVIMVNKRINQRMFQAEKNTIYNPVSGSVLGQEMSRNGLFEYFIVPQHVNQGTATPTGYQVIYNTTDLSEDAFYFLTFEQCFNYFNWQGAVRVPAPLMYADGLATLVGDHLKQTPTDAKLREKIYSL